VCTQIKPASAHLLPLPAAAQPPPSPPQGLGLNLDWYQERTSERENHTVGGFATALCYDGELPNHLPYGLEVDWVKGSGIVHVDMNVFCPYGWDLMWVLMIPAVNYLKDKWR
jgi:hypothetical protein